MSKLDLGPNEHRLAFVIRHRYVDLAELLHISNELAITDTGTAVGARMWPGLDSWPGVTSLCGVVSTPQYPEHVGWMLLDQWDYWFRETPQSEHNGKPSSICVDCFLELLT